MRNTTLETRLEPNLFSGHFDKAGTVLASRHAHSSCARMTQGAKTCYTTSLTSVTSPNDDLSRMLNTKDFDTISSEVFLYLHFSRAWKNLCYQGKILATQLMSYIKLAGITLQCFTFRYCPRSRQVQIGCRIMKRGNKSCFNSITHRQ